MLRFGSTEIWIYVFACDFGCVECVLPVVSRILFRWVGVAQALRVGVGFAGCFGGWVFGVFCGLRSLLLRGTLWYRFCVWFGLGMYLVLGVGRSV